MFTPVKAITAGALVFALGSAFLIAEPFQQAASVPGAEAEPVEPTWVTGTAYWAPSCTGPVSREVDGIVTQDRGRVCEPTRYEMSDPRLSGQASWRWNTDIYETADGDTAFLHGATFLRNDGGGWTCPVMRLQLDATSTAQFNSDDVMLCTGDGGYAGLSALVVQETGSTGSVQALVFSGDAPPLPDPPAAE